jgi:class 3 adenylate cyclase
VAAAALPVRGGADACVMVLDMARFSRVQTNMTLLMGPQGSVALAEQINGIVSEGFKRAGAGAFERYMYKFGGDGGIFFFNDAALAHRVAVEVLNQAEERNKQCREQGFEDGMRCFRIGIDFGRVDRDGRNEFSGPPIARATRLEGGGPSGEIRTSAEFYRQLPTELRKAYGDEEPIVGKDHDAPIPGRRLAVTPRALWPEMGRDNLPYAKPKQPNSEFYVAPAPREHEACFVVCPLSAGQGRVAAVFDELIAPACARAGFDPRRANELPGDRKQVIAENLANAPLVIAYLGNPATGWNSNVILEVGFRLATGLPLVMISDADAEGREPEYQRLLPFQIAHHNVITVGPNAAQKLETLYEEIAENRGTKPAADWASPNAVIEFKFTRITDVIITDANEAARHLFGAENVRKNQGIEKLRTAFAARTDAVQADARRAEQLELLTRLWQRSTFGDTVPGWRMPRARIPVVFNDAPTDPETGKPVGYLPVILRYTCDHDVTRVRYMYLRVSASMTMDAKAGYYVCDL